MRTAIIALCALTTVPVCLPSAAHDHATGIVKERMDMMELMAKRMKAIRERVEEKRDLAAIKPDAQIIAEHASHTVHLFPPGGSKQPTDARETIWRNWPDFQRKAAALEVESKKLVTAGIEDFARLREQVRAVSQTCTACHEKYRIRRRR
jgi:cytochrome c556